ncbi:MAG TPA: hypothetical protein VGN14_18160 [Candidatus Elarobacter sp.]
MNATAFRITGIDMSGYMCKDALEPTRVYGENRGAELAGIADSEGNHVFFHQRTG